MGQRTSLPGRPRVGVPCLVGSQRERWPLFRYEFVKPPLGGISTAPLQVHAHRDAVTHAMSHVGRRSARAGRRGKHRSIGRMEFLHFPLGGARFRASLEDVLQMLVEEFGVDAVDQWQ